MEAEDCNTKNSYENNEDNDNKMTDNQDTHDCCSGHGKDQINHNAICEEDKI